MDTKVNTPIMLYTEQTPNPESLKFVTNRMLYRGTADFRDLEFAKEWSPMAEFLFEQPYVKAVYISNNFVTITKEMNYDWMEIKHKAKVLIKDYVSEGKTIIKVGFEEAIEKIEAEKAPGTYYAEEDAEVFHKIKGLIDKYVKPAVEMDGGNIELKSFQNGIVTVLMQGSCSGCPSSTVTLKSGIEGLLKRQVPEVREVVSEMA